MVPPAPTKPTHAAAPPSLRGDDKRSVILRAAHALFLRDGYSATSMDAITREAGVSKATVYAHFDGKQTLYEALVRAGCEDAMATSPQLIRRGGDPVDELFAFFEPYLTLIFHCKVYAWDRMVIAEASRHPENARLFHECTVGKLTESVEHYLRELNREGQIATADVRLATDGLLAIVLLGPLYRALMMGPPPANWRDALRFGLKLFLHGVVPSAHPAPESERH